VYVQSVVSFCLEYVYLASDKECNSVSLILPRKLTPFTTLNASYPVNPLNPMVLYCELQLLVTFQVEYPPGVWFAESLIWVLRILTVEFM